LRDPILLSSRRNGVEAPDSELEQQARSEFRAINRNSHQSLSSAAPPRSTHGTHAARALRQTLLDTIAGGEKTADIGGKLATDAFTPSVAKRFQSALAAV
jgi:hypothetical protein